MPRRSHIWHSFNFRNRIVLESFISFIEKTTKEHGEPRIPTKNELLFEITDLLDSFYNPDDSMPVYLENLLKMNRLETTSKVMACVDDYYDKFVERYNDNMILADYERAVAIDTAMDFA